MAAASFDLIAADYDELWTRSHAGQAQRAAVWRHIRPLFREGDRVLDLGCGTGEDAVHLTERGISIQAIDSSLPMVQIARSRGVRVRHLALQNLDQVTGVYEGAISNFGALNCVECLAPVSESLARLIRPGGYVALCTMGRFCGWETAWYALQGKLNKARRRWSGRSFSNSLGTWVHYPSRNQLRDGFEPHFELVAWHGIGVAVPPSFVKGIPAPITGSLAVVDDYVAHWPGLRALSDHRLAVLVRR
ncbi:MAG: class I SAM-dependent methyltransferase [Bryobacteraceae bacterium]